MLTNDDKKGLKIWTQYNDWENTDFIVGTDSFDDIQIDNSESNGFWYFINSKKGLIKRFVLENYARVEKSCTIKLIKKPNGKFTPRFDFQIWNTTKKAFEELDKETVDNNLLKARVNLDSCHEQFFDLLSYIINVEGVDFDSSSYAIFDPDKVTITDENKVPYIKKLIDEGYSEEVWISLVESKPTLITKLSYARSQSKKQKIIDELTERLKAGEYTETSGSNSWQKWIYKHNWLFGVNYKKPIEKAKINLTGIMPDYLFPTLDGFVDILEIKLPDDEVIIEDGSHAGAWKWSPETNIAIGQVVNYLGEVDRLRYEIEKNVLTVYGYELFMLKPRAYILIGNNLKWTNPKTESLRKMNDGPSWY